MNYARLDRKKAGTKGAFAEAEAEESIHPLPPSHCLEIPDSTRGSRRRQTNEMFLQIFRQPSSYLCLLGLGMTGPFHSLFFDQETKQEDQSFQQGCESNRPHARSSS